MADLPPIQVNDWIERDTAPGYCRWARVIAVHEASVSVVYLDDDTPVKDSMVWSGDHWQMERQSPSGYTLRERGDVNRWRATLGVATPF